MTKDRLLPIVAVFDSLRVLFGPIEVQRPEPSRFLPVWDGGRQECDSEPSPNSVAIEVQSPTTGGGGWLKEPMIMSIDTLIRVLCTFVRKLALRAHLVSVEDVVAVMIYTFARVSAAVALNVGDYSIQGKRSFIRLQEKGGKYQAVPVHHTLIDYLDAYITAAGIAEDKKGPLFRSSGRGRQQNVLGLNRMSRHTSLQMIKRRVAEIGLPGEISNHSFRSTGITDYLRNGGTLAVL